MSQHLHDHLRLLERQDKITVWHTRLITAGTDWVQAVDEQFAHASIILLLISPAFLSSDYCYSVEMQQAIQKHERGEARVIPIRHHPDNCVMISPSTAFSFRKQSMLEKSSPILTS